jgi:pimeloyl-ACP methyl ester carboxylesterase
MGTRDPDFSDAAAEARWLAGQLGADSLLVDGAGHYPQTEMPDRVAPKLLSFIGAVNAGQSSNNLQRPLPGRRGSL